MKKRFALIAVGAFCIGIAVGAISAGLTDNIQAELRRDFTVVIDGQKQTFKNAQGETVYPVLYDGTTYLPVRAIGEIMGKTVYWYEDEKRIELRDNDSTVTDADVIVGGGSAAGNAAGGGGGGTLAGGVKITLDEAKDIALKRAGLDAADVTFIKTELDRDNGVVQYELEFYSSTTEYEIDVNAETGDVRKWKTEAYHHPDEHYTAGQSQADTTSSEITVEQAKNIALEKAGLSAKDVTFVKAETDYDDGIKKYEIEFRNGRTEYETEINAANGTILTWEVDNH